jgi:hypothetical protein
MYVKTTFCPLATVMLFPSRMNPVASVPVPVQMVPPQVATRNCTRVPSFVTHMLVLSRIAS